MTELAVGLMATVVESVQVLVVMRVVWLAHAGGGGHLGACAVVVVVGLAGAALLVVGGGVDAVVVPCPAGVGKRTPRYVVVGLTATVGGGPVVVGDVGDVGDVVVVGDEFVGRNVLNVSRDVAVVRGIY